MKILSWNVNGIRSVHKKGFLQWIEQEKADFVCLQELKAQEGDIPDEIKKLNHHLYTNTAEKKGYSGVAVFAKEKPEMVGKQNGMARFDSEGRYLELKYQDFTLINVYIPHGGRQKENLDYKLKVYDELISYLAKKKDENVVIIGDFNIAHTEIDLARPRQNMKNIMFTPEERAQIDRLIGLGFVDTFRAFNKENSNYTWWPWMANARERNLGWRIDYCFVSKSLAKRVKSAFIENNTFGSDHCPIGIEV